MSPTPASLARLLAASLALCATAHAAPLTVTNLNPNGAGSLDQVVAAAAASDIIVFAPALSGQSIQLAGTLVLNKNLTIDASALPAGIKLLGNGRVLEVTAGRTVVLRKLELRNGWSNEGSGIYNAGTLTLDSCTIANNGDGTAFGGGPTAEGGGIYNAGTLTLNQCTLTGNFANSGAAIYNHNGASLAVNNSTITDNTGNFGAGGIRNAGSLTLTNTVLSGNTTGGPSDPNLSNTGALSVVVTSAADSGPGSLRDLLASAPFGASMVFDSALSGQTLTLTSGEIPLNTTLSIDASALAGGLTISGNNTSRIFNIGASGNVTLVGLTLTGGNGGSGGAIYAAGGSALLVSRCTVSGNTGFEGGAILNDGTLQVDNSTFSGNTGVYGGALQCRALTTLTHCTFVGNHSANGGGGVFNKLTTLTVHNSIIADNTPAIAGRDIFSQLAALAFTGANLVQNIVEDRPTETMTGPAPLNLAPLLAPLGNYGGSTQTMSPLEGSPAIDAGGATALTTDQRGTPRPLGLAPDLGAVEVVPGFTNAPIAGLPGVERSSVAWGDYDNDGRLDFLLTGYFWNGANNYVSQLWRNTGSGFENVTASVAPGLPGVSLGSVAWGDYDNDGRLDFLLTGSSNSGRVSQLWRNTGSGFTNVTGSVAPGLLGVWYSSVAWGDYDNDGRLDFLLTGSPFSGESSEVSQIWRNTGSGFSDVTASVAPGLPGVYRSSVAWGDYDNDSRLDFLLTGEADNNNIVSQLWRNTGSGFENVTASVAPGLPQVRFSSVAWGDYDNDGRLDFLLTGSVVSQIWRNTGSGFTNVTASVAPGLPGVYEPSVAWGDYDNDGRLDFLLTGEAGNGYVSQLWRNNYPALNTSPSAPTGLGVAAGNSGLTLSWSSATDAQTPTDGLAYHLRVGTTPGGSDLLAPMASANGQARLPRAVALQPARSRTLYGLPPGQRIYWSVQAADTSFAASPFATEQSFTHGLALIPANGIAVPGDTNGDGVVSPTEFAAVRAALGTDELATLNGDGYYTEAQVQSLHVGTPLISQISPGRFRLTLGVRKSTNLTNPFTDFRLDTSGSSILVNPDGKLEFEFPATDNAAFFRIGAE